MAPGELSIEERPGFFMTRSKESVQRLLDECAAPRPVDRRKRSPR